MPQCKTCKWFDPTYYGTIYADDDESEQVGACDWPAERLPYSLRWGNRERVGVYPLEGESCPTWESKA
jgi:hypothetical protein